MRTDAWLVNVGRGGLVDTEALIDSLEEGVIGGAALDVPIRSRYRVATACGASRGH